MIGGGRAAILGATVASTVFAAKNVLDEYWILGTWYYALLVTCAWLLVPYAAALVGTLSKRPFQIAAGFTISILCAVLFLAYALNGSTRERSLEGAQHMHLILVPVLLPIFSILALAVLNLLRGAYQWIAARGARTAQGA